MFCGDIFDSHQKEDAAGIGSIDLLHDFFEVLPDFIFFELDASQVLFFDGGYGCVERILCFFEGVGDMFFQVLRFYEFLELFRVELFYLLVGIV